MHFLQHLSLFHAVYLRLPVGRTSPTSFCPATSIIRSRSAAVCASCASIDREGEVQRGVFDDGSSRYW